MRRKIGWLHWFFHLFRRGATLKPRTIVKEPGAANPLRPASHFSPSWHRGHLFFLCRELLQAEGDPQADQEDQSPTVLTSVWKHTPCHVIRRPPFVAKVFPPFPR